MVKNHNAKDSNAFEHNFSVLFWFYICSYPLNIKVTSKVDSTYWNNNQWEEGRSYGTNETRVLLNKSPAAIISPQN